MIYNGPKSCIVISTRSEEIGSIVSDGIVQFKPLDESRSTAREFSFHMHLGLAGKFQ